MSKVIAIVGPTAVGKTAFALELANHIFNSPAAQKYQGIDLLSADSRQVYQGLEITSGAELGSEWQKVDDYWQHHTLPLRLFGVSFLPPDQEWSVAHFQELAQKRVQKAEAENRLLVIVGGTGLYVEHVTSDDQQLHVPPNQEIRQKAEALTLEELQSWLKQLAPEKFECLNNSDQHNPRRLVRAIEVVSNVPEPKSQFHPKVDIELLTICLQADYSSIEAKILKRVSERLDAGSLQEVEQLQAKFESQVLPAFSTTGVKFMITFLSDQISKDQLIEAWSRQERQYAKRQLTWWKKRTEVKWFDTEIKNWRDQAYGLIESWLS